MTNPEHTPASDPISDDEFFALVQKTAEVFSPSAPIDQRQLFSGRVQQLMDVMNAFAQKGQHAILFGERGVGKTSLATVILTLCKTQSVLTPVSGPVNCDSTMTFSSLWKRILRGITFTKPIPAIGFLGKEGQAARTLDTYLPDAVTPDDVRHLLSNLPKTVIVIDELDRADQSLTALLADTIKNLSDHAVDTTLLLVGVADSVDALIREHQSVERALVQIRMPRMSSAELLEIIDKGTKALGMEMGERERKKIAKLSQGLPHYTHLLSLHATQHALQQRRRSILGLAGC